MTSLAALVHARRCGRSIDGVSHAHDHGAARRPDRAAQQRALWIALALNGAFLGVEVVGGLVLGSLALLADAAHMLTDVAGLAIALVAQRLLAAPQSASHSFGLQRAEVLGAQANGVLLLASVGWIGFEAVRRIAEPAALEGPGLLVVAAAGLVVNVVSAVILARARGQSLNMRGAYVHMLADGAGSVAAVGAGVLVLVGGSPLADPIAALVIAVLVLWSAWGLLRDTTHVLMEGVPRGLDPAAVQVTMEAVAGVASVHHLHLWNLASDVPSLSAHVVITDEVDLHEAQLRGEMVKAALARQHDVEHATLELECHVCATPDDAAARLDRAETADR